MKLSSTTRDIIIAAWFFEVRSLCARTDLLLGNPARARLEAAKARQSWAELTSFFGRLCLS